MGLPRPSTTDNNGDESVFSPKRSEETLLGTERGTDAARRLETDAARNLYVNVAAGSLTATEASIGVLAADEALAVNANVLTTVVTYTATAVRKISRISCSGQEYGKVELFLNTVLIETRRMGPDRNVDFGFDMPLGLAASDILDVKVTHYYTGKQSDYTAVIYGV